MTADFHADPAFEAASVFAADWPLCHVRIQNDARYCWVILLPRVEHAVELSDLSPDQRATLMEEMVSAGELVAAMAAAEGRPIDKINTAALGNVTRQLHVHILGRRKDDDLWPDPVWGRAGAKPCDDDTLKARIKAVRDHDLGKRDT
ncbi:MULTISPECIES: HIT domain-containing protein [unclassified Brevundimonas]|uniref:HIT domain-containing protein n=1 Tax=unclassified Brevundimonas TaxID=2622653 RepID=UPI0025C1855C|nr:MULTISPECIES: HIT domain-containing protein [unclassified Brevundimonas]